MLRKAEPSRPCSLDLLRGSAGTTFFAALVLATAAYIIVSKLTKKPPQEVLDLFYYAKSFDPADADSEAVSPAKAVAESSDGTKPSTVSAGIQMSADQFRAVLENA